MTPELVKTELRPDGIAVVTIDNPPVNAHSGQVLDEMGWTFDTVSDQDEARVVVLTGAGKVFCAGADIKSAEKIERCAKVAGEVVYTVTTALNEYFAGDWTPPKWKPSEEIQHCIGCHSPDSMGHSGGRNTQQGHMECLMCHDDHMKAGA